MTYQGQENNEQDFTPPYAISVTAEERDTLLAALYKLRKQCASRIKCNEAHPDRPNTLKHIEYNRARIARIDNLFNQIKSL